MDQALKHEIDALETEVLQALIDRHGPLKGEQLMSDFTAMAEVQPPLEYMKIGRALI